MYHKGIDSFYADPGEFKEMFCRACGAKMKVERSAMGPTGFAEAMAKHKHFHDHFSCPNAEKPWHDQVVNLVEEKGRTSSARIAKILQEEINEILEQEELNEILE